MSEDRFDFSKFGLKLFDGEGGPLKPQISEIEANMLRNYAKKYGKYGNIVELGSYCGGSGSCMALGLKDIKSKYKLYCIDHQLEGRRNAFKKNMQNNGLVDYVEYLSMKIEEAHKKDFGKIKMIFWDASEKYSDLKKHFNFWYPKLEKNGVFMIHMYTPRYSRVKKFADELKEIEEHLVTIQSTAIFIKRGSSE